MQAAAGPARIVPSDAPGSAEAVAAQAAPAFDLSGVRELRRREFAVVDPDGYPLILGEPTADPPTCAPG